MTSSRPSDHSLSLTAFDCDVTAGLFTTGAALKRLGSFYARAILDAGLEYDVLFGPAYKVQAPYHPYEDA
jgi:hypothetical protein